MKSPQSTSDNPKQLNRFDIKSPSNLRISRNKLGNETIFVTLENKKSPKMSKKVSKDYLQGVFSKEITTFIQDFFVQLKKIKQMYSVQENTKHLNEEQLVALLYRLGFLNKKALKSKENFFQTIIRILTPDSI